jgi:hypothetical protein
MQAAGIGPGPVRDELESHLRDKFAELARTGMSEDAAFRLAADSLGQGTVLRGEFEILKPWWRRLLELVHHPIRTFPNDHVFVAKCGICLGLIIASAIFGGGLLILSATPVDRRIATALGLSWGLCFAMTPAVCAIWSGASYLHHRSLSSARVLAGSCIVLCWLCLLAATPVVVRSLPYIPAVRELANHSRLAIFMVVSVFLNRLHAGWRRHLDGAGVDSVLHSPPTLG